MFNSTLSRSVFAFSPRPSPPWETRSVVTWKFSTRAMPLIFAMTDSLSSGASNKLSRAETRPVLSRSICAVVICTFGDASALMSL